MSREIDVDDLTRGVQAGDRAAVARAITLVESTHARHRAAAQHLMAGLAAHAAARAPVPRVGISGAPGVGKSTFIQRLGQRLTGSGLRVGVLAVDPSSTRTGGSVLGDKTRMGELAADPKAFIRPSPSAGTLGGVASATAQAVVILEAAGFDAILVETVGVGQSEITVAGMVDTFLLLTLARTGDQLQGIKRGILEIADVISINKADDREAESRAAARELGAALRLLHHGHPGPVPPVLTCSARTGARIGQVWDSIVEHRATLGAAGIAEKRAGQRWDLTWSLVRDDLETKLRLLPDMADLRDQVRQGTVQVGAAVEQIIASLPHTLPTACHGAG